VLEESHSGSSNNKAVSSPGLRYSFDDGVNRDKEKEKEVEQLANDVKKQYDKKIKDLTANEYEPETETQFDKLRKRVQYLAYHKKMPKCEVPLNMQLHDELLNRNSK